MPEETIALRTPHFFIKTFLVFPQETAVCQKEIAAHSVFLLTIQCGVTQIGSRSWYKLLLPPILSPVPESGLFLCHIPHC